MEAMNGWTWCNEKKKKRKKITEPNKTRKYIAHTHIYKYIAFREAVSHNRYKNGRTNMQYCNHKWWSLRNVACKSKMDIMYSIHRKKLTSCIQNWINDRERELKSGYEMRDEMKSKLHWTSNRIEQVEMKIMWK